MKFKNYIETESGIKDTSTSPGTAGQVLSSTVTGTSWIDPDTLEAAASKLVVIACKNVSGVPILKGTPVYQTGTVGATDVIEVEPADATISTGYLPAIGILQTTLNNQGFGNVVITGEFLNYSTSGIPSNNPGGVPITGDTVYLAAGGGLTCIRPTGAGNAIQNLGLIGKVSGGNAGSITVASIMRANDVPNLPTGRIWIGDGNTIVSDTIYVNETNGRVGIGTTSPLGAIQIGDGTAASPSTNQIFVLSNTATTGGNSNLYLATGASGTSTIGMGNPQFSATNTAGKITYSDTVDTFSFDTNFSTKMVINGSGNVGIGTTNPQVKLHVANGTLRTWTPTTGTSAIFESTVNSRNFLTLTAANEAELWFGDASIQTKGRVRYEMGTNNMEFWTNATQKMVIEGGGNVGIGTTSPGSKLQVDGEIDANGGDGYRINGKPWAAESSDILRLGDWDGEGFSTSIYDENSIEIFKVKDEGVIINCDRTSTTTYGSDASLVVGGSRFSPYGAGVLTLLNNDPISIANDSTGLIQFAIRDDSSSSAGYTSASIKGSIDFAAGSGSSGGGVLDFLTSTGGLGASPTTRMRIDRSGNVGIGTTSVRAKLHVNGGIKLANDTDSPSASKAGTFRYYTSGNNSYVDMCMQTGASTYAWVNIVTNSW